VSGDEHPEIREAEALAAVASLARLTRAYFLELREQGWSDEEALRIVLGWQHATSGGRA
jgi:hypothetical protein